MSLFITLVGLTTLHFLSGYGIIRLFGIKLNPVPCGALAIIIGVLVASLVPFLLQLFYIPLTFGSIFPTWIGITIALNIKTLMTLKKDFAEKPQWRKLIPRIKLYELPAIILLSLMLFVSAWRCYYYPGFTRDGMSGPEALAEYTLKEHTLINSVFSTNLESTNNQFKSPYFTDLQVVYRLAGFPFGNVWLSLLSVNFFIFLYHALSRKLHPLISGLLLVFFIATPESYAYTFLTLYDYSNMIFLFLGFYYLFSYFNNRRLSEFYFAALLLMFSVYIRSETLVLIGMTIPFIFYSGYRAKEKTGKSLIHIAAMLCICTIAYYIPVELYNNHYLPQTYKIDNLLNKNIFNLQPFFDRLSRMTEELIFGDKAITLWGYFIYIFLALFLVELILKRKYTREAGNWLIAVLVIYLGLPLLGFLFPLMDLDNTTKRGLFKILPLMLLYMGNNQVLIRLSEKIRKWEGA